MSGEQQSAVPGRGLDRRDFLKTGLAALAGAGLAQLWSRPVQAGPEGPKEGAKPNRHPNIIFILSDDVGLDYLSCYGSDGFKTPQIDALAAGGLRFETCYCAPLCGPTRCEFITGRYPFRTGGLDNGSAGRPSSDKEVGLAKTLKQAGYATASAGKWRQMGENPGAWGFDEYITDPRPNGYYWEKSYTHNGKLVQFDHEVYYHDMLQEFFVDFITRNREKSFFFYYPMHLVHVPIMRTPDSKGDGEGQGRLADNVAYMDKLTGKVVAELDKLNLRENTLILFAGDNGTAGSRATIGGRRINGGKGSMLEGGARVPLIANWKGTTPAGKVCKDMVDFTDLYTTFAELAGAKLPEGVTLDGHSFVPQLKGQEGKPREWIFVQLGAKWYVRERDWKLNEAGELFGMKDVPFVEKPVAADTLDPDAMTARKRLQTVLENLKPTGEGGGKGGRGRGGGGGGGGRKGGGRNATPPATAL